jgi:hypothetical protein
VADDGGADAVVAHEDVADAVNGGFHGGGLQRTFAFAMLLPAGSNVDCAGHAGIEGVDGA